MKKIVYGALVVLIVFFSAGVFAQPQGSSDSSQTAQSLPFTLLIVGTRHFSDVDIIRTNIQKIPSVHNFFQKVSSQNHIEFSGTYAGEAQNLTLDIEGLASDRFEVRAKNYKDRGMVITLRKIATTQ